MLFDDSLRKQIRIGSLLYSARNLGDSLHRFAKHLFVLSDFPGIPYRLVGTSTAVSFSGLNVILCCHHQIHDTHPDRVAINSLATSSMITGSRVLFPIVTDQNRDTDIIDVRAFVFNPNDYQAPNLGNDFFPIQQSNCWPRDKLDMLLVLGYPSQLQNADYEKPEINSRAVLLSAAYDGPSHSPSVHRLKMKRRDLRFDSDGMSGGPVFYIGRRDGEFFVGFAGMTIRGGSDTDFLHYISAEFFLSFLNDVVTSPRS